MLRKPCDIPIYTTVHFIYIFFKYLVELLKSNRTMENKQVEKQAVAQSVLQQGMEQVMMILGSKGI